MASGLACGGCGVVLPGRVRRCPSCGGRTGIGPARIWLGVAAVATLVVLGLVMMGLARRPKVDPALAPAVQAYLGLSRPSSDGRGSEVTAYIDSTAKVPVDVTVRFRALDFYGGAAREVVSGPHRRIAPGASKPIQASVPTTPIASWEIEVIELAPSHAHR